MPEDRRKIGILGGTFDPVHMGHLILGEEAYQQLSLDSVWFMPNGRPPHKAENAVGASDEERAGMLRLAIEGNPHFSLSLEEMRSGGVHYTWETLMRLGQLCPDTDFYFIIGADSLSALDTWKYPDRICRECILAAAVRDRVPMEEMEARARYLREKYGADVRLLRCRNIDISSTDIRNAVREGRSIRYYVPENVRSFIQEEHLYKRIPL